MFKLGFWQGTQKWICHTDYRGRINGGYAVSPCCTVWGALPNANGTGQTNGRREGFTRCSCSGFGWASRCRRRTARLWLWADSRFSCSWGLHFMYNKCMQIRCERLHRGGCVERKGIWSHWDSMLDGKRDNEVSERVTPWLTSEQCRDGNCQAKALLCVAGNKIKRWL